MHNESQVKYCNHTPEREVFKFSNVGYYATSASEIYEFSGDLVVNFTNSPNVPLIKFTEISSELDLGFKEEILIPWPDFGLPKVKFSFWKTLHKFIQSHGWTKVCFHCQAGHGRTGTALASMLVVHNKIPYYKAISLVREVYCQNAIETIEQCKYLQKLDTHYNKEF